MNKVFFIANTSWYLYNFRKSLIKVLLNDGYFVFCAAPRDEYSEKLKTLGVDFVNIEYDNSNKNPLKDILFFFKLLKLFKTSRPDVVLSYTIKANIYGGIAARFIKIPFVANVSGLGYLFIRNSVLSKFSLLLYKLGLKEVSKVFFQNNDDYLFFKKKNIIKTKNVEILPGSGVDLTWFSSVKPKENSKKFVFLFASRLLKDKGIKECIAAFKKLSQENKNIELQVLGKIWSKNPSSVKQSELDNWINSGFITYLGFADDVRPYIENADVVLLPSYREGMSRILLEAASMSKPIITTNVAGCREVVEDGITGFLCKARDPIDLAEKMTQMIKLSNEERALMGKRGREKMEKEFDEKIVINKYLETINKLIK